MFRTTPLFSLTSRSLRARHLTTTLILVSSDPWSTGGPFLLLPAAEEATDSAGDMAPDLLGGATDAERLVMADGRRVWELGGRMLGVLFVAGATEVGLGRPAICLS